MLLVACVLVALGLGSAAGWRVGAEVSRGMPWGFFVLALAVAFLCVIAPVVWPTVIGDLAAASLRAFAGGLVTSALAVVSTRMEDAGPGD